jgi:hypothetical protein
VPVFVNDVEVCDGGGTMIITGTIDNVTGLGTLSVTFVNCVLSGITINGPSTWRIQGFDVFNLVMTDVTMSFARLTLRGIGFSFDAGGSIRIQTIYGSPVETITLNLVELNNNTGKMRKSANVMIVSQVNDFLNPTSFNQILTGQVFHSDYGFVTVATPTPFVFGTLAQLFPDSGEMLLTGDANRTIRVTALNSTLVQLQLDTDGDGTVDNTARLKWTELSGPVGSNLADNDGDLMHNSWETVYMLNPDDAADATADNDGDTFNNLAEYMAGTNPIDAGSHP